MKVQPVDHGLDLLKSDLVRSPGLHASDIYGSLFKSLDPKRYDYATDPDPVLLSMGTAWEKHLEYLLIANGITAERPDEYLSPPMGPNGVQVAFSPDLIIFNGVTRLGEIKLTSMSAKSMPKTETNELPDKLDKYLCQMKLYARWLGLYDGWLAVLFLHQPWKPELRCFNLTFTERELVDNELMCVNHAIAQGML